MANPQWFIIARREFLERVRTKWFVVVTLLGPLAMVAIVVLPALLAARGADHVARVRVVDESQHHVGERLSEAILLRLAKIEIAKIDEMPAEEEISRSIRDEQVDGYLHVPAGIDEGESIRYRGDNATNLAFMRVLFDVVTEAVRRSRAVRAGLDEDTIELLFADVAFEQQHDTGAGRVSSGTASFIIGYISMFIVYMAIILYAVNVLRSVVQEKTSRIVEIVVCATRPRALMLGKILGVGSVGLLQLGIWGIVAVVLMKFRGAVFGLFGISLIGLSIPSIRPEDVAVILTFFLLGYFFYASIYAAIGAMVSSEQEGQQAQTPVVIMLVIPVLCVQLVANDPRSFAAELLTMIPLSSPVLMPMRYILGGVDGAGLALSIGILFVTTGLVVVAAARIYRVGILMVGKRPSARELWRWLRH